MHFDVKLLQVFEPNSFINFAPAEVISGLNVLFSTNLLRSQIHLISIVLESGI